jgi:hypothetical protein
MELTLVLAALVLAGVLLAARRDAIGIALAAACGALALAGGWLWQPGGDRALEEGLPAPLEESDYATSDTCRACHPGAYEAWHRSFHRTMTQRATPANVLGDFEDVVLESRGHETRLERRGDELWADTPDPLWFIDPSPDKPPAPPRIRVRVVMTTGSHHLQNYWVRRPSEGPAYRDKHDNGALVQIPWVWDVADRRWLPVQDSFLAPPDTAVAPPEVWNSSCHGCHSVGTEPRLADAAFDTRSVELGIACEACHGPAEEHVRANAAPWRRYAGRFSSNGDTTIVNPARLDSRRSAEVCGQCHSFSHEREPARFVSSGAAYRPGDVLADTRAIFRYDQEPRPAVLEEYLARDPGVLESAFWADGTMRVAGREFNALIESACYQRGELSCLSCHSMHGYAEPADQLAPDATGRRGVRGVPCRHHLPGRGAQSSCRGFHGQPLCQLPHAPHQLRPLRRDAQPSRRQPERRRHRRDRTTQRLQPLSPGPAARLGGGASVELVRSAPGDPRRARERARCGRRLVDQG